MPVVGSDRHVVPQPLVLHPGAIGNRAGPCDIVPVLDELVGRPLLDGRGGHRHYGENDIMSAQH